MFMLINALRILIFLNVVLYKYTLFYQIVKLLNENIV